jgi:hypothetical protein
MDRQKEAEKADKKTERLTDRHTRRWTDKKTKDQPNELNYQSLSYFEIRH